MSGDDDGNCNHRVLWNSCVNVTEGRCAVIVKTCAKAAIKVGIQPSDKVV